MKKLGVVCVAIWLLAGIPALSWSQGFLPGLSSVVSLYSAGDISAKLSAGYFATDFSFGGDQNNPFSARLIVPPVFLGPQLYAYSGFDYKYTVTGLALGLSGEYRPSISFPGSDARLGFIWSGRYMIPQRGLAGQSYRRSFAFPLVGLPGDLSWNVSTQWWWVEGLVSLEVAPALELLAGCRYESIFTKFYSPVFDEPSPFVVILPFPLAPVIVPIRFHSALDEAEGTAAGFQPLVGLRLSHEDSTGGLRITAMGWPVVIGGFLEFNETVGGAALRPEVRARFVAGYYWHLIAEYERVLAGRGRIGGFLRWDYVRGTVRQEVNELSMQDPIVAPGRGAGGPGEGSTMLNSLTVGVSFTLDFLAPDI